MPLNLDSLSKAIDSLSRAILVVEKYKDSPDRDMLETVRAGVIQSFEVSYEQCWKMIQRWIRENRTPEDGDNPRTRKELFRRAARYGLIVDPVPWFTYGEARNLSSHTYDKTRAESVYEIARNFLGDAQYLLHQLEEMND